LSLILRVKPRAERQIEDLALWWSENRLKAPGAVRTGLKAVFDLLVLHPGVGTLVENARDPNTRRLIMTRLEYYVYYRERGKHLEIVAFWPARREQQPKV
jgi:plasmid stabilization system protein ParE